MLMIRLSRIGRKKHPHFRLVISEKSRDTLGRTLEILGHYHPLQEDEKDKLVLNKERIEHWLKEGAQASNTVNNLLIDAGLVKGDKKRTIGSYKSKKEVEEKPEEKKVETPKAADTPKEETPSEEASVEKPEVKEETPKAEEKPTEEPKAEEKKEEAKTKQRLQNL